MNLVCICRQKICMATMNYDSKTEDDDIDDDGTTTLRMMMMTIDDRVVRLVYDNRHRWKYYNEFGETSSWIRRNNIVFISTRHRIGSIPQSIDFIFISHAIFFFHMHAHTHIHIWNQAKSTYDTILFRLFLGICKLIFQNHWIKINAHTHTSLREKHTNWFLFCTTNRKRKKKSFSKQVCKFYYIHNNLRRPLGHWPSDFR